MKRAFALALFLALMTAARAETANPDGTGLARFDEEFRRVLAETGIPGGAYAIVREGKIVHAAGHGVRVAGGEEPVTADTVFRVASVSKTFAAELTALLVRENKLRWDDRIGKYLPDLAFKRADHASRLQIQHLLGQSTGIVPNAYDNLLDADMPLEKILPHFRTLEPICIPGQCYTYQNVLFSLIDPVIEQATKLSYGALLRERLFQPLEMRHASLGMDAFLAADDRAMPHVRRDDTWLPAEIRAGYYQVAPAAGINASANDLGNWLIAQLGHRPDVLPPDLIEELTQKRVRTPKDLRRKHWRDLLTDAHYGLGWRIYQIGGEELYLHSGWVKGYVADIAYSRSHHTGLAVLLNAESSAIAGITTSFWKNVLNGGPRLAADDHAGEAAGESVAAAQ